MVKPYFGGTDHESSLNQNVCEEYGEFIFYFGSRKQEDAAVAKLQCSRGDKIIPSSKNKEIKH